MANLSNKNRDDYFASKFCSNLGYDKLTFSRRDVNCTLGDETETVPLVHLGGVNRQNGHILDLDLWPRNHASFEDLQALPKAFSDVIIRFGKREVVKVDEETGEEFKTTEVSKTPRIIAFLDAQGNEIRLSGEKRAFIESTGRSEVIDNQTPSESDDDENNGEQE